MEDRLVVSEDEAYRLLAYMMASAETIIPEPHLYGVMRLVDAASRLAGFMLDHSEGEDTEWLEGFRRELEANKGWLNKDEQQAITFMREANRMLAAELKRRTLERGALPEESRTPGAE